MRVLYIAGLGRSGSTLLERVLGQYPGVFAGGEICHVWERGVLGEGRCGCGSPLLSCPVWSAVLHEAFGASGEDVARRMVARYRRMRTRHLPLIAAGPTWRWLLARLDPYPANLERLYRSIARVTGEGLVVDASKDPLYAFVLRSCPSVELWMVHVLRDPRAAAFSWRRRKPEAGYDREEYLPTYGPVASAAIWTSLNQAAAAFGRRHPDRYLALRYEDLVSAPLQAVARIGALVGESFGPGPFTAPDTVLLGPTHSAWGNPNRFEVGPITFRLDDEWRHRSHRRDHAVVTAMTWPWLLRHGYPVGRRHRGARP